MFAKPPLPLMTPLNVRLLPLLSTVAVCVVATAMLLAMFKPAAPVCSVLLPVTFTSPAPSAALLPTCTVMLFNVVPIVPAAGPKLLAAERTAVPPPVNVSVSGLDWLAMAAPNASELPGFTTAVTLPFKAIAVLIAFAEPAVTLIVTG